MAKFSGPIGYAMKIEQRPGFYTDRIEEHNHMGDIIQNSARWTNSSDSTNDDLVLNHQISILADPFARDNFHAMKYVRLMGTNWKITSVRVQYPRLILTIGGVYNGPVPTREV